MLSAASATLKPTWHKGCNRSGLNKDGFTVRCKGKTRSDFLFLSAGLFGNHVYMRAVVPFSNGVPSPRLRPSRSRLGGPHRTPRTSSPCSRLLVPRQRARSSRALLSTAHLACTKASAHRAGDDPAHSRQSRAPTSRLPVCTFGLSGSWHCGRIVPYKSRPGERARKEWGHLRSHRAKLGAPLCVPCR